MIAAMHINVKVGIAQEMAHSDSKSRGGTKPKMRISHACQG